MSESSARLSLPYMLPSQAQKHVTHNEALQVLDALTQLTLEELGATQPPAVPEEGATYALGAAPSGEWTGQGGMLAQWVDPAWIYYAPSTGWRAWDKSAGVLRWFDGSDWQDTGPELQNLDGLGIGTTSDAVNRLAASAAATLLTHDGAGHQLKLNKAAAGETASLLYQSDWTGHAEMGLTGDNDFHIKTSPNGASWTEALVVDSASGTLSGAAVQSHGTDTTANRLMPVAAFGLGATSGKVPTLSDLDDVNLAAGFYGFTTATVGTRPPGASSYGFCLVMRQALSGVFQLYINSNGAVLGFRTATGGTWDGWEVLYGSHNLVGPVSQSGGTPTGAVIERGSNGNGEYTRFADGTQICTQDLSLDAATGALGALYAGAASTGWSFPASFAPGTEPQVAGSTTNVTGVLIEAHCASHTSASFRAMAPVSTAAAPVVRVSATGRWF